MSIEGHADRSEIEGSREDLSLARAESVENYLERQAIDGDRLQTRALGASRPLSTGATSAGRQQNRRVEIVVVD